MLIALPTLIISATTLILICLFLLKLSRSPLDAPALSAYLLILNLLLPSIIMGAGITNPPYYLKGAHIDNAYLTLTLANATFYLASIASVCFLNMFHTHNQLHRPLYKLTPQNYKKTLKTVLALTAITALFNLSLLISSGSFSETMKLIRDGDLLSGHMYLRIIYILPIYISSALLSASMLLRHQRQNINLTPSITLFIINLIIVSVSGDRDQILGPILIILFTHQILIKKRGLAALALIAFATLLSLGSMAEIRQSIRDGKTLDTAISDLSSVPAKVAQRIGESHRVSSSLKLSENPNWLAGNQPFDDYRLGIMAIIPRSIWESKPTVVKSGARVKQLIQKEQYSGGGWPLLPAPLALYNGGVPALILFGSITGLLLFLTQVYFRDHKENPFSLMLLFVISLKLIGEGFRPSFLTNTFIFVLPFIALFLALKIKKKYINPHNDRPSTKEITEAQKHHNVLE